MNYLPLQQFKATNFKTLNAEHKEKYITEATEKCAEISKFFPCYPRFKICEDNGDFEFLTLDILLLSNVLIVVHFHTHPKKYSFYCEEIKGLKNITYDTQVSVKKTLVEPQQVGVLTTKKIQNWVDYYTNLCDALRVVNDFNYNRIQEFLKSIEDLNVVWSHDKKSGYVVRNGIEFSFQIGELYVSERIKLHYGVGSTLENFLGLSENKYVKK